MTPSDLPAGWVAGNPDGFPGVRIYPAWAGALDGKRLVCRDIRIIDGEFFVHNPWKQEAMMRLGRNIREVEAYIERVGVVPTDGTNVWD